MMQKGLLILFTLILLLLISVSDFCDDTESTARHLESQNTVTPGKFIIEPPTLLCLGFEWYVDGDENHNATVAVSYRKKGQSTWKKALPFLRIQNEKLSRYGGGRFAYVCPNMFAGSILDLAPDTAYECRFMMSDPDGVLGNAQKTVTVRTRTEPKPFEGGKIFHLYPSDYEGPKEQPAFTSLMTAYRRANPNPNLPTQHGNTILVHAGLYKDPFSYFATYIFTVNGTPEKPIVIRAAGDGEVIFDGNGASVLFDVRGADYMYFEGLTIRNTDVAFYAGQKRADGCVGLTIKHCRIEDVGIGIYTTYAGSKNFYIADNVMIGRHDRTRLVGWISSHVPWEDYPGYPAPTSGPDGSNMAVSVYGAGHVVCHNYIEAFHDGINNGPYDVPAGYPEEIEDRSVSSDFYNNHITNITDNALQPDDSAHNIRVFRNLLINGAHVPICITPIFGGPAYFIRNITYHFPSRGSVKLYGASGQILAYHNTFCTEVSLAGPLSTAESSRGVSNVHFRNNLILGEYPPSQKGYMKDFTGIYLVDTYTSYSTSDYNGFRPNEGADPQFVWNAPANGLLQDYENPREQGYFKTLGALCKVKGQECHSILVDYDTFQHVEKADTKDPTKLYAADAFDFSLKSDAAAIDAGLVLPNVNDGFNGKAPDLGALEYGQPVPVYGPRE